MKKDKKMMPRKRGSKCLMATVAFSLSLLPAQGEAVHFTILPTSPSSISSTLAQVMRGVCSFSVSAGKATGADSRLVVFRGK